MSKFATVLLALLVGSAVPAGAQAVRSRGLRVTPVSYYRLIPPPSRHLEDPADSLYRLARGAMSDGNYRQAARLFLRIVEQYPQSDYAGDALYYRAYSLYQLGGRSDLRGANESLAEQERDYPRAPTREDAKALRTRIEAAQARRGDSFAAESLYRKSLPRRDDKGCPSSDDDVRVYALQGLMQMDAESALPILRQVLENHSSCREDLRKQAVFIVSQKPGDEATSLLLETARTDPSSDVRAAAIQWLGQSQSPRAVMALDSIASSATDEDVLNKAVFALSQSHDERAGAALRRIADDDSKPTDVRKQAIFWYGQTHRDAEDMRFLRDLFRRTRSEDIRESIIQAMSQAQSSESARWLIDIARDKSISIDARKNALFWAGQTGADLRQLVSLYDETSGEKEIQNQLIFVFSQRHEREAVDKLMDIATNDPDRDLRKQAIFWLGQSRDPRVQKFLLDLINR